MGTLIAVSPLLIRALKIGVPILLGFLLLPVIIASAVLNKSTVVWPVAAPTHVSAAESNYVATGWTMSSPFGWRAVPSNPSQWELHDGVDLAGPMFCDGCPVPPMGDVEIASVDWDQPYADDPRSAGAGVVVDMALQHPEESGTVRIRYGHLQPYYVWVRTQTCTQIMDCPNYEDDPAGSVTVSCAGTVVEDDASDATHTFVYATPGECRATVSWPAEFIPDGPVEITFDQQIVEGQASSNAAITFRAQRPPPPTPTPTLLPTDIPTP